MSSRKRQFGIPVLGLCILVVLAGALYQLSKSRSFQFFGGLTSRVDTDQQVVALTFDDAPSLHDSEVLDILREKKVKATFYEIGRGIEQYRERAKAIVEAGMEVGNHSYSHQRFLFKTESFIDSEIQRTNELIRSTGYQGEITFRPPNGKKLIGLPWYLRQHGIKTITWDVEPDTYATIEEGDEKTNFLVNYVLEHTRPGSIILLHPLCDACTSDRRVLGRIIDGLQSKGYTFVTISQLLSYGSN